MWFRDSSTNTSVIHSSQRALLNDTWRQSPETKSIRRHVESGGTESIIQRMRTSYTMGHAVSAGPVCPFDRCSCFLQGSILNCASILMTSGTTASTTQPSKYISDSLGRSSAGKGHKTQHSITAAFSASHPIHPWGLVRLPTLCAIHASCKVSQHHSWSVDGLQFQPLAFATSIYVWGSLWYHLQRVMISGTCTSQPKCNVSGNFGC